MVSRDLGERNGAAGDAMPAAVLANPGSYGLKPIRAQRISSSARRLRQRETPCRAAVVRPIRAEQRMGAMLARLRR